MPHVRGDFCEWFEDKAALVHGGMRYGQDPGPATTEFPNSRMSMSMLRGPFFLLAPAAHLLLDGQHPVDQLPGHFLRVQFDGAIQEPGLSCEFDGLGFVKRRDRHHFAPTAPGDRSPFSDSLRGHQHLSPARDRPFVHFTWFPVSGLVLADLQGRAHCHCGSSTPMTLVTIASAG